MAWYLVKRLLQLIPVFFGATLLVYFLVFMTPGDPLAALCGDKGCSPGVAAALTQQYHLNDPFFVQYFSYLGGLVTGDLGVNFSGREISSVLVDAFPATFRLAVIALIFEAIFGITFGLYAGLKKGGWFDSTVLVVSLIVIAVPIVMPLVVQLGTGVIGPDVLIWFGIITVIAVEMGLLTPPFGISVFVVKSTVGDLVTLQDVFAGVMPYVAAMALLIVICLLAPGIVTVVL